MKKMYLIIDVTDKDPGNSECRYLGDCKGMTGSPEEANAMLQNIKQTSPGREIVKKTLTVTEVEMWSTGEETDLCNIVPTIHKEAMV